MPEIPEEYAYLYRAGYRDGIRFTTTTAGFFDTHGRSDIFVVGVAMITFGRDKELQRAYQQGYNDGARSRPAPQPDAAINEAIKGMRKWFADSCSKSRPYNQIFTENEIAEQISKLEFVMIRQQQHGGNS